MRTPETWGKVHRRTRRQLRRALRGEDADGGSLRAAVTGDKDPGYGSTSKMIAESALCLIEDVPALPRGVYTPKPPAVTALIERLKTHAGLTFELEA